MVKVKTAAVVLASFACIAGSNANPKIGTDDSRGFVPNNGYGQVKDQLAMESGTTNISATASDKAGRFGFPTYTTDGQNNYPQTVNNVVPGLYGPVKLDIGGLVLGTIVGLGAFFILPKLFHVISGPYGGYKRSEDEPSAGGASLSDIYRRVGESLETMNLDTTSCLQRAICMSAKSSGSSDGLMNAITKNDVVKSVLAGTDWETALEVGRSGESCGRAFPKCPFTVESIIKPLTKYLYAA